MANTYIHYPNGTGGSSGIPAGAVIYPTFADFPVSEVDGSLAYALDTGILYIYSVTDTAWLPITAGLSSAYYVNTFTLTPTDISNGFVTLSQPPTVADLTVLSVIGGPVQSYGDDFIVAGAQLSWTGLFLDGVLVSGDKLVVQFN